MKKLVIILLSLLVAPWAGIYAQGPFKYYRVDQVKTILGEITEIKNEKCYHKNDFTVIYLKEKESGEIYRVEVSPEWFFSVDLLVGSKVEVTGSYSKTKDTNLVMARSITFRGEVYEFRDKNGFPLWRGKGKKMRQLRQGQRKGKMRQRGRH